ncbi:MAG: hypothetical protein AAFU77_05665 [Myxococcota bacterium]
MRRSRYGGGAKGSRGSQFYQENNPPYGATFTYFLRDGYETLRKKRRDNERENLKAGKDNPYPTWDALRAEDREEAPALVLIIRDSSGAIVREMTGPAEKGLHRVAWDMRYPATSPVSLKPPGFKPPWWEPPVGPLALPGTYTVELAKRINGKLTGLTDPKSFALKPMERASPLETDDRAALLAFQRKTAELQRAVEGAVKALGELNGRVEHVKRAIDSTPAIEESFRDRLRTVEGQLHDLSVVLTGDRTIRRRNEPSPWSIESRVGSIVYGHWHSLAAPTGTHTAAYDIAATEFERALRQLRRIDTYLGALEGQIEQNGAPWTPGRLPSWSR